MTGLTLPATLAEAILTEPWWLQFWLLLLVSANIGGILFVASRQGSAWKIRKEPIFIIVGFACSAMLMDWMYVTYGYVRLLGLAHIVGWAPAYLYVLSQRKKIGLSSGYGKYIHVYLLIAGLSLLVDGFDVIRYFLGDGELYMRWA